MEMSDLEITLFTDSIGFHNLSIDWIPQVQLLRLEYFDQITSTRFFWPEFCGSFSTRFFRPVYCTPLRTSVKLKKQQSLSELFSIASSTTGITLLKQPKERSENEI